MGGGGGGGGGGKMQASSYCRLQAKIGTVPAMLKGEYEVRG